MRTYDIDRWLFEMRSRSWVDKKTPLIDRVLFRYYLIARYNFITDSLRNQSRVRIFQDVDNPSKSFPLPSQFMTSFQFAIVRIDVQRANGLSRIGQVSRLAINRIRVRIAWRWLCASFPVISLPDCQEILHLRGAEISHGMIGIKQIAFGIRNRGMKSKDKSCGCAGERDCDEIHSNSVGG
jgi:hypothetical protein